MRKIGIEIFYWLDNWSDDQVSMFECAKSCGFDAVEISFVAGPEIDVARWRVELDRLGLDVYCSTGLGAATDITSPDAAVRQAGVEYLRRCLDTSARLGSPLLGGVTYAPWLLFPDTTDLRPYRERAAAALHQVAHTASDLGLILTMEILNRWETAIFNTVAEALEFLRWVEHPAVKLQLDTYHMNMEEDDIAAAIRLAGDHIGHFHCADSNRKLPGRGHIDWAAIGQALRDVHFQGAAIIETFPNPAVETGRTVHTWRPLVDDYDGEAKVAVEYLRKVLS